MHWIDVGIVIIIVLSILTGFFRGFIKESIALCLWIFAIWLAFHYSEQIDPWFTSYIHDKMIRKMVDFFSILVGTLIAGSIINALVGLFLKCSGLSIMDKCLGTGFGFVRGVFIVSLIIVILKMTAVPYEPYTRHSRLYPAFQPIVNWLYAHVPHVMKKIQSIDAKKWVDMELELS